MRLALNYLFFIFFSSLLLSGCKKFEYEAYYEELPKPLEDLSAYSYFKTGTYWIYKDSASGVEDSMFVYSDTSYSYFQTGTAQEEGNYMFYGFKAHSVYDTYDYLYNISMGNYGLSTKSVGVERIRTKPGDYVGETYLMTNRFVDGEFAVLYTGTGTTYFKQTYDSISLLNQNYYAVAKYYDSKNASEYESPTNFYIAKNIGIIRKEKLDTIQTWNLIRYHIVQ